MAEAIRWWATELRQAELELKKLPAHRVMVVRLHELALTARRRTLENLLDFLSLDDDQGIRRFFSESVTPKGAAFGRWHRELKGKDRAVAHEVYMEVVEALSAERVSCLP